MANSSWDSLEEDVDLDLDLPPQQYDPLAELAVDLALSIFYIESGKGMFCEECTCQLKYHCTTDRGDCELCGCDQIRIVCVGCNKLRELYCMDQNTKQCMFCLANPKLPVKREVLRPRRVVVDREHTANHERAHAARLVLKELSD